MTQMEEDLGTRLDWVAVDHFDTAHPHRAGLEVRACHPAGDEARGGCHARDDSGQAYRGRHGQTHQHNRPSRRVIRQHIRTALTFEPTHPNRADESP